MVNQTMTNLFTEIIKSLRRSLILIGLVAAAFLIINGCSSSKECMQKELRGVSSVVGNEPFTKQAIITDKNEVYILTAPDSIRTLLYDNQGHYFELKYNSDKDSAGIHIIKVIEAKKL